MRSQQSRNESLDRRLGLLLKLHVDSWCLASIVLQVRFRRVRKTNFFRNLLFILISRVSFDTSERERNRNGHRFKRCLFGS